MTIARPADAHEISPDRYVLEVLERDLDKPQEPEAPTPSKSAFGILAKYGPAPSAEEIDANRAEMLPNFATPF